MSADEEGELLGDQVGEVDEGSAVGGVAGEDKDLGPVVLDVLGLLVEAVHVVEGGDELLGLGGGAPVGLRLAVADEEVEGDGDEEGDDGGDGADEEHDDHAEDGAEEGHPVVVVLQERHAIKCLVRCDTLQRRLQYLASNPPSGGGHAMLPNIRNK